MPADHSLLHGIQPANCNTPWDRMRGTGCIRVCPTCNQSVFQTHELNDQQLLDLVKTIQPDRDMANLRFYRRNDGTLMLAPGTCGNGPRNRALTVFALDGLIASGTFLDSNTQIMCTLALLFVIVCMIAELSWRAQKRHFPYDPTVLRKFMFGITWAVVFAISFFILLVFSHRFQLDLVLVRITLLTLIPIHAWIAAGTAKNNFATLSPHVRLDSKDETSP